MFHQYINTHILEFVSNHYPIILNFSTNNCNKDSNIQMRKIRRFEQTWLQNEGCKKIVINSWNDKNGECQNKLKTTTKNMSNRAWTIWYYS